MANTWKGRAQARQLWAKLGPKMNGRTYEDETSAYDELHNAMVDSYAKRPGITQSEIFSVGDWMMQLVDVTMALTADGRIEMRLKWT